MEPVSGTWEPREYNTWQPRPRPVGSLTQAIDRQYGTLGWEPGAVDRMRSRAVTSARPAEVPGLLDRAEAWLQGWYEDDDGVRQPRGTLKHLFWTAKRAVSRKLSRRLSRDIPEEDPNVPEGTTIGDFGAGRHFHPPSASQPNASSSSSGGEGESRQPAIQAPRPVLPRRASPDVLPLNPDGSPRNDIVPTGFKLESSGLDLYRGRGQLAGMWFELVPGSGYYRCRGLEPQ
jgi:hypothetical protein